jgi:hypothetical protein
VSVILIAVILVATITAVWWLFRLNLFFANLLLILGFGVLASWWLLRYTDWFPAIGGLLALGGAFSWVALISKILSKDRLDALQRAVDDNILNREWTRRICLLLNLSGLVCASFLGSIQVDSVLESSDRAVWVSRPGTAKIDPMQLQPGGHIRKVITTSWWSPAVLTVKVSGYPDKQVEVSPWGRSRIYVPTSLFRPVVLIRPTIDLMDVIHSNPMKLVIRIGNISQAVDFDGRPIWLGCDAEVEIPSVLQDVWRNELGNRRPSYFQYWLHPRELSLPLQIQASDEIEVELQKSNGQPYTTSKFTINPFSRQQDFPQEVVLDVPPQN